MNIPKYSIDNGKVIWFILAVMVIGGTIAFLKLPKKEDSPFSIKTAVLVTQYPGASPEEVERLITEPIEREIQSMSQVREIKSESGYGVSKITIDLEPTIPPERMPIKWDELRRKVSNIEPQLPQGASKIMVNDDFGDVYGIYYALTADNGNFDFSQMSENTQGVGFTFSEMRDVAQKIKRGLTPIAGVQKVMLYGEQQEVVNIFIDPAEVANIGLDINSVIAAMQAQNQLVATGELNAGEYQIKVVADGTYGSLDDIRNQVIVSREGQEVRIGDIATVGSGYLNPPSTLMRVNGQWAIGIGVATGKEDDVVAVGDEVGLWLENFKQELPAGMEIVTLYPENVIAREANNGFIMNLIESLVIVVAIILLVMGVRAGLLIGSSLLFSVGGTLLIMLLFGVGLNRTSLAAFIIAMGMLVDNAIVVTDNAQMGIKRGIGRSKALIMGATLPQWGLLGATFIAVASFLPLYLAPESVAEIVKPLFIVLAISLGLSWLLAMSQTPLFGTFILKENRSGKVEDPYDKRLYHKFEALLGSLVKLRYVTLGGVVALLLFSLWVMSIMPQSFFPSMNKPYARADLILPDGFSISDVEKNIFRVEQYLQGDERVKNYSITMGSSPLRYYLASASYGPMPNYANVLIETHNAKESPAVERDFYNYMVENYPNIITRSSLFMLSPIPEAKIEIGFIGDDIDTLTQLTEQAIAIAQDNNIVMDVRNSWGNRIPSVEPYYSQVKGTRLGITREQYAYALKMATTGVTMGGYRSGDQVMPILLKNSYIDSLSVNDLQTLPLFSSKSKQISIGQVSEEFDVKYNYGRIKRYNRQRVMLMQCDPRRDVNAIAAFNNIYAQIKDTISIPPGYLLSYFGEQQQQDKSNKALGKYVPLTFLLIYFVLLLLFPTAYRKPLVIMAMLPLIFIGVVWGLILFGKSLDFFAILGLLGLIGMNIKNAIVLVEQIGIEQENGLQPLQAVIQATKSRIVPVTMASGTTILGMVPLLFDSMFAGMAATIMGGLFMATILTIFVLPVTYCIFFGIGKNSGGKDNGDVCSATDYVASQKGKSIKDFFCWKWVCILLLQIVPFVGKAQDESKRSGIRESEITKLGDGGFMPEDTLKLTVADFKSYVEVYSKELLQAGANRAAMAQAVAYARSAMLPRIDMAADANYRVNGSSMNFAGDVVNMPHDSYSVVAQLSQNIYGGGARLSYGQARIRDSIAAANEELTRDNILYMAEVAYWKSFAQKQLYEITCRYVQIVDSLVGVLQVRYDEGLVAQTDYLQMLSRLKEAQISRSQVLGSYIESIQNLNVMMGLPPQQPLMLVGNTNDVVLKGLPTMFSSNGGKGDAVILADKAIDHRIEYKMAILNMNYEQKELNLVRQSFGPKLDIGLQQSWGTPALNFTGDPKFNTNVYASLKIPIFDWGARDKKMRWQKAVIANAEYEVAKVADDITKEVYGAKVRYEQALVQLPLARDGVDVAQSNLDLNTFSYNEGRLTILDVLSAQLTWIQAQSRYIDVMLQHRLAGVEYLKAIGMYGGVLQ